MFNPEHNFGGDWTEEKLGILERYLTAYLIALKDKNFYKMYIDAFAGTGYRSISDHPRAPSQTALFSSEIPEPTSEDEVDPSTEKFLEGSAVRALKLSPCFDSYHFIERSTDRSKQLSLLQHEHPERRVFVHTGDANEELQKLLSEVTWSRRVGANQRLPRAVLFLDPYGMNVSWKTLEAIAATKAIDVWYLFPSGMGVARLLRTDGQLPEEWRARLTDCLGTSDWFERFYEQEEVSTLFGVEKRLKRRADLDRIEGFLLERLAKLFPAVAPRPRRLLNSRGYPMYSFCFAASNPVGAPIALRIARHILEHL